MVNLSLLFIDLSFHVCRLQKSQTHLFVNNLCSFQLLADVFLSRYFLFLVQPIDLSFARNGKKKIQKSKTRLAGFSSSIKFWTAASVTKFDVRGKFSHKRFAQVITQIIKKSILCIRNATLKRNERIQLKKSCCWLIYRNIILFY